MLERSRRPALVLAAILTGLSLGACSTMRQSTPRMSIQFPKDPDVIDDWVHGFGRIDAPFAYARMVPPGETEDRWNQSIVVQTLFAYSSPNDAVDAWLQVYRRDDPNAKFSMNMLDENAVVVESSSEKLDEVMVRKFMEGPDGVYTVAYVVHPGRYDRQQFKEWRERIHDARLIER